MRKLLGLVSGFLLLLVPGTALALSSATSEGTLTIAKNDVKNGTFFAAAETVNVEGTINGDLVCAGSTVRVSGKVTGDVICAAQNLEVTGDVEGNVRVAGQNVRLSGVIGRNLMSFAQALTTSDSLRVGGDAGVFAQTADYRGVVAKDIYGAYQTLTLAGTTGPVWVSSEQITLGNDAKVNGDLNYSAGEQLNLDSNKVTGEVHFHKDTAAASPKEESLGAQISGKLYWIANYLAIALVFLLVIPRVLSKVSATMGTKPGPSIGWGLAAVFGGPIAILVMAFSFVGLGLMLLSGASWLAVLFLAPIFVGVRVGQWLLERADWKKDSLVWATLLGTFIALAIMSLPVVGPFVGFVTTIWAVGAIVAALIDSARGGADAVKSAPANKLEKPAEAAS